MGIFSEAIECRYNELKSANDVYYYDEMELDDIAMFNKGDMYFNNILDDAYYSPPNDLFGRASHTTELSFYDYSAKQPLSLYVSKPAKRKSTGEMIEESKRISKIEEYLECKRLLKWW